MYRSVTGPQDAITMTDITNIAKLSLNMTLIPDELEHYKNCSDYDNNGVVDVSDVVNMWMAMQGTLTPGPGVSATSQGT